MSGGFRATQRQFSAHLRDPENNPPPAGVEERRLQIYRDLFYNTVEGILAKSFPVIQQILDAGERWHPLVRRFYAQAHCDSPYFTDIPERFMRYLVEENGAEGYPAYLPELAHYEWLELALEIAKDIDAGPFNPDGELMAEPPVLNPVYELAEYQWPVSQIDVDNEPGAPLATPLYLLLYRDAEDRVRFMEINAITAMLIQQLDNEPGLSGTRQLEALAAKLPQIDPAQLLQFGADMLEDFRARGLILGTAVEH